MCTMWIDGFNGVARHLAQNIDFAVAAAADVGPLRAYAEDRGWDQLRLTSARRAAAQGHRRRLVVWHQP